MQDLLGRMLKKGVLGVAGIVVSFGVWSAQGWFEGSSRVDYQELTSLPAQLWEGGKELDITLEMSEAGRLMASFVQESRHLNAEQQLPAGRHQLSIGVPPKTEVILDATLSSPGAGARISWTLRYGGEPFGEDSQTLERELEPNHAFGLQAEFETR